MTPKHKSYIYMGASILLSTMAQLSMKAGMLLFSIQTGGNWHGIITQLDIPALLWVGAGLACYGFSMLFWMSAIARLELSLAYPMLSLSWVLVYIVAVNWPMLHEHASWIRTLGILFVVFGVILIARSDIKHEELHDETH